MSVFGVTISVIPKLRVTVFRGSWTTGNPSSPVLKPREENVISKPGAVVMNSIGYGCSAVAAATGRGFESRRPD